MKFICNDCVGEEPCILQAKGTGDVPHLCPWLGMNVSKRREEAVPVVWKELKEEVDFEMHGACAYCGKGIFSNETCDCCKDASHFDPKKRPAATPEPPPTGSGNEAYYCCPDASHFEINKKTQKEEAKFLSCSSCFYSDGRNLSRCILCEDYEHNGSPCHFEPKRRTAATPEPPPTGHGQYVLFEALRDICARADAGQKKYGTMLRTHNGRNALNDAYQEAIDMIFYFKQALMEMEDKK